MVAACLFLSESEPGVWFNTLQPLDEIGWGMRL
jgi:hypothetical protein